MRVLDHLRTAAQKLRIIQLAPADAAAAEGKAHPKIETRSLTLAELMSEIRQEEVRALADAPAELTVALEKVCDAAGVKAPASKWTIDRLRDVLRSDKFKNLSRDAAQRELVVQLTAEKVSVEDLVKDAIARDQAIDAFAQFVREKMKSRESARQSRIVALETQMRDLQDQIAHLKRDADEESQQWQQWKKNKTAYEKDMAWAIGFLLDKPIVSIDE
jgi:hypothetical protein